MNEKYKIHEKKALEIGEVVELAHCNLRIATVDDLMELVGAPTPLIKTWDQGSSDFHPIGPYSTLSIESNPAVICDYGAAICTPLLAFDNFGNAVHVHDSFISNEAEQTQRIIGPYNQAISRYLKGEITKVISGTNLYTTEEESKSKDAFLQELNELVQGDETIYLVGKRAHNQTLFSPYLQEGEEMRGFIFIPKFISVNKRNELLAIPDKAARPIHTFVQQAGGVIS